ncbi:hypothetical protein RH437_004469 [Salmonella enterica]|nr:hypothetical protein [Salmonella enterica]
MDISMFFTSVKDAISAITAIQSNDVLRERITFINEQLEVIQKANEATEKELTEVKEKNIKLGKEIAAYREKEEFIQHRGAAFRKNPAGGYISAVYCPNCFVQVGPGSSGLLFFCKKCGWLSVFKGSDFRHVIESLPRYSKR